jgi:hypothetical protein
MFTPRRLYASCILVLCLLASVFAQGEQPVRVTQTVSTVTAAAAAERVRFTAPSNVVRMQLQIISETGQTVFDVSSKGNVLDWSIQDGSGQRLQGSYLAVVTVKSLSGRLMERIGSTSIGEKQVELQRVDATQLNAAQQQAIGPMEENAKLTILKADEAEATTVLANNGNEGQIIRDRGALSFRLGDFFSGSDKEQMRLTEEGNLGVGTDKPQAKLDVAGTVRAREGFLFADGSKLNVKEKGGLLLTNSDGSVVPNAAGTGTQNRVAKWTETGGSGTLGDSLISESGGNVVVGNSGQTGNIQIFGTATQDVFAGMGPDVSAGPAFNYGYAGSSFGRSAGFFNVRPDASAVAPNPSLRFMTANVQRMIVTNTGDVGIGNLAPGAKLDVTGNINTSTQYNIGGNRILSTPGTDNAFLGFQAGLSNGSGDSNSFFGRSAGQANTTNCCGSFFGKNAGINSRGSGNAFFGYAAGVANVDGVGNTAIGTYANVGSSNLTNATAIGANAQVNQSDSLVLGSINGVNFATANTKVGIGITAPSATFHVVSYTHGSAENTATFQAPNIGSFQSHIHYGTNGDWYIRSAAGAGKVVLEDTGGNVGIGTASPVAKLDVRDGTGASGSGGHLQIGAPNANADEKIIVFGDSTCAPIPSPCVYIGEQDADDRMVFAANGDFHFKAGNVLPDLNASQTLGSSSNKWKEVWAVNGTIQTSDVRLKRGITNLKYGLSQVMRLRPVSFQWKSGNDNGTHLGLIAQEVDAVMPEAVEKSADANAPLGMNYSNLIPVLIKAIQEQQVTLDRAQAEIKTLRAENEALSKRTMLLEAKAPTVTSTKKVQAFSVTTNQTPR